MQSGKVWQQNPTIRRHFPAINTGEYFKTDRYYKTV